MKPVPMLRVLPFLFALALLVPAVGAQFSDPFYGRGEVRVPSQTEDGVWDGTWWYVNRDVRMVLWCKTENGQPKVKLQFLRTGKPENFTTDWNGQATYETVDGPGTFALTLTERDGNTMHGSWNWTLNLGDSSRSEIGTVKLYRAGDGRRLVMLFDEFERRVQRGERVDTAKGKRAWTFLKASKRQVIWDELPF